MNLWEEICWREKHYYPLEMLLPAAVWLYRQFISMSQGG